MPSIYFLYIKHEMPASTDHRQDCKIEQYFLHPKLASIISKSLPFPCSKYRGAGASEMFCRLASISEKSFCFEICHSAPLKRCCRRRRRQARANGNEIVMLLKAITFPKGSLRKRRGDIVVGLFHFLIAGGSTISSRTLE